MDYYKKYFYCSNDKSSKQVSQYKSSFEGCVILGNEYANHLIVSDIYFEIGARVTYSHTNIFKVGTCEEEWSPLFPEGFSVLPTFKFGVNIGCGW